MLHQFKITSFGIVVSIYILLVPTSSAKAESYTVTNHMKIDLESEKAQSNMERALCDPRLGLGAPVCGNTATAIVGPAHSKDSF